MRSRWNLENKFALYKIIIYLWGTLKTNKMDLNQHIKNLIGSKLGIRHNPDLSITILSTDGFVINEGEVGWSPVDSCFERCFVPAARQFSENESYPNGFYSLLTMCKIECKRLNEQKEIITETPPKFYVPQYVFGPTPGALDDYWAWYARMVENLFRLNGKQDTVKKDKSGEPKSKRYKIEAIGRDQTKGEQCTIITGDAILVGCGCQYIYGNGIEVARIAPGFIITELK